MSAHRGRPGEALVLPAQPTTIRQRRHHAHERPVNRRRHILRSLHKLRAAGGIVMLFAVIAGALGLGDEFKLTILAIGTGAATLILKTSHSP
jgi:hypothetical protein